MPLNPDFERYVYASVSKHLVEVAEDNNIPWVVEHIGQRTPDFMQAPIRVEIRVTGPFIFEPSHDFFDVKVMVSVLLTGRMTERPYDLMGATGLFREAMQQQIPVWNYGGLAGDYEDSDPSTQIFFGCLSADKNKNFPLKVFYIGDQNGTDKLRQVVIDQRYQMELGG
jgi:hypothetical protein